MDKRRLHHLLRKLKVVKPYHLLIVAVLSTTVCLFALRANNARMVELRDAVYAADKSGDDVQPALQQLQAYVTNHMNTSLASGSNAVYPPLQLKYTYERLVGGQAEVIKQRNAKLYTEAQAYCEQRNSVDFSGRNRVPCIQSYVTRHGVKAEPIPDSLYKFDFASPAWSPDLAGWSMLLAILSWPAALLLWLLTKWLKSVTK